MNLSDLCPVLGPTLLNFFAIAGGGFLLGFATANLRRRQDRPDQREHQGTAR